MTTRTAPHHDTTPSLVHAFCPTCNPNPQLGQTLTAVCGTRKVYLGHSLTTDLGCAVCAELEQTGCPTCE